MILQRFRGKPQTMRRVRISVAVVLALLAVMPRVSPRLYAQGLTTGLFDRYIDALRQELGIPGLSGVIVQDRNIIWKRGFGHADVSASIAATPDTPYPIINLTETVGSALLLQQCVDYGTAELSDRVIRWIDFPDQSQTLAQVLAHLSATSTYNYDPTRFGLLSGAAEECTKQPYPRLLANKVLDYLAMTDSVPGREAVEAPRSALFTQSALDNYRRVLGRVAVPYRVGSNKSVSRSDYSAPGLSASTGLISTALDLVKFDSALNDRDILAADTLEAAWSQGNARPTGLGWFVQGSGQDKLVWHFGVAKDAYSSLIVKVPGRKLTFILLANSDGLGNGLSTSQPNATQSHFVRLFLQFFAP